MVADEHVKSIKAAVAGKDVEQSVKDGDAAKKHADDAENVGAHADIKVFVLYICLKIHERIVVSIN